MTGHDYLQDLLAGGSVEAMHLEEHLGDIDMSSLGPDALSLLFTRAGGRSSSNESLVRLTSFLHAATLSADMLKQLFRLPRQKRDETIRRFVGDKPFKSAKESDFSPLKNARLVHLTNSKHAAQILAPILPAEVPLSTVSGEELATTKNDTQLLKAYEELRREHLHGLHRVLIVLADGQIEQHAVALSRLSNTPLLILQLDTTPGTASQQRDVPFIPPTDEVEFPPAIWLRYSLAKSRKLSAWDVSSGKELHVGLELDEMANAVPGLMARLLILHDLRFFPALPLESRKDLPTTPTRWFSHDRQQVGRFSLSQGQLLAGLLEHYWTEETPTDRERIIQSRLEFLAASLPFEQRAIIFDAAVLLGHEAFIDQIKIRRLWVANDFGNIQKLLDWTPRELDDESRRLGAEAAAANRLVRLLQAAPAAASRSHKEHIVCVLHASVPEQSGGYAIRAHGIFEHLARAGVRVTPVTRPGFPETLQEQTASEAVDGITYHRLPGLASYYYGEAQYMLESIDLYKQFFVEQQATKVHVRSTFLIAIPAMIAARQLGLKVVYEVSGLWELVYRQNENSASLHQRAPFAEYWETQAVRYADEILTMNDPMHDLLLSRGAKSKHLNLAPNAVDAERFTVRPDVAKTKPLIGYIGSIVRYENLGLLVKAVKQLVDEGLDFEVRIIGDGIVLPALRRQIEAAGLTSVISTPGRIPHDQVADQYQEMDIMVYPRLSTLATDTVTPLKPFEALAMGKAVVVSDVPPLLEIAGGGQRGLIFPSNSISGLADALRKLIRDENLRAQLGTAGRHWIEQERSWTTVVDAFTEAYAKL